MSRGVILVLKQLLREGIGHGVGHFHKRGNAADHGCSRLRIEFCFMGKPRLPKVHLVIDEARNDVLACCIEGLVGLQVRKVSVNFFDKPVFNQNV